jgi:hypothetical protein
MQEAAASPACAIVNTNSKAWPREYQPSKLARMKHEHLLGLHFIDGVADPA